MKLALRVLIAVLLAVSFSTQACAMDKAEVEAIVKEYIKNHPEELAQSLQKFSEAQREKQEDEAFRKALAEKVIVPVAGAPSIGSDNAQFTLVEFSDFQCPYCARSVGTIKEFMKKNQGKVRLVFRNMPLPNHTKAPDAAKAAMAAGEQGRFWDFREKLMESQAEWSSSADHKHIFVKYAREMALDVDRFERDMAKPEYQKKIDEDIAFAHSASINGTPTYFLNGVRITGARELAYFDKVLAALSRENGKKGQ
jgi:protein-disulfide isomerase